MPRRAAAVLLVLLLAPLLPVLAAVPAEVSTLISAEGDVAFSRSGGAWFAVYPELRNCLEDHVKTGADSVATLEFDVGGRVGLNASTEIVLVGERDVQVVDQGVLSTLVLQAGGIWAKITGQSRPLQVETSAGVLGIKGTEFVVDTEAEGEVTLSVLEGEVEVRPDEGEPLLVKPGYQARLKRKARAVLKRVGTAAELRKALEPRWKRFNQRFGALVAAAGQGKFQGWSGRQVDLVRDPVLLGKPAARPGGRGARVNYAAGLSPNATSLAGRPTFAWLPVPGAQAYALLLSGDPTHGRLDWAALVREPRAAYPENGRPLAPGRYWWRLIPIGPGGKPLGRASQTWFDYRP